MLPARKKNSDMYSNNINTDWGKSDKSCLPSIRNAYAHSQITARIYNNCQFLGKLASLCHKCNHSLLWVATHVGEGAAMASLISPGSQSAVSDHLWPEVTGPTGATALCCDGFFCLKPPGAAGYGATAQWSICTSGVSSGHQRRRSQLLQPMQWCRNVDVLMLREC